MRRGLGPRRTCVGCREVRHPDHLVRVARQGPGEVVVGAVGGRGAWLCAGSLACLERALAKGALARALRGPVDAEHTQVLRRFFEIGARMHEPADESSAGSGPNSGQEG